MFFFLLLLLCPPWKKNEIKTKTKTKYYRNNIVSRKTITPTRNEIIFSVRCINPATLIGLCCCCCLLLLLGEINADCVCFFFLFPTLPALDSHLTFRNFKWRFTEIQRQPQRERKSESERKRVCLAESKRTLRKL